MSAIGVLPDSGSFTVLITFHKDSQSLSRAALAARLRRELCESRMVQKLPAQKADAVDKIRSQQRLKSCVSIRHCVASIVSK